MENIKSFEDFLNESFRTPEGEPIGVDSAHRPIVNEASAEFIDKGNKDKEIAVMDKKDYVVIYQKDFLGKNVELVVNKDQIADLCKVLQKMA